MIYWAPFLHFYQPPTQFHAVLKRICKESYRPLMKMFLEHPSAKVTINICGVLTEMLNDHGGSDILEDIKKLAENNQLEFVDSGKHHPILPLIPPEEVQRQINLNRQTNQFFFKDAYKPKGFFPPEMCYSAEAAEIICKMGYKWILISGIACQDTWPLDFISTIPCKNSSLCIFYRDDIISNKISFHNLNSQTFIQELFKLSADKEDIYVVTAMDAETFGHHIQHWEELFLAEVYETIDVSSGIYQLSGSNIMQKTDLADTHSKIFQELETQKVKVLTISELVDKFPAKETKQPQASSWSTTKDDIAKKNYYPLWNDTGNKIHELQWEYVHICFELVNKALLLQDEGESSRLAIIARGLLDRAVHSCQFWWANKARGMWDINMINKGLMLQEEVILNAYKAINISSIKPNIKRAYSHKVAASRDTANKIRDLLLAL